MALRMLIANDRIKNIEKRLAVIENDLEKLTQEENDFEIRYQENKDNDDLIQSLYDEAGKLEERRQELEAEQAELISERQNLGSEIKEYGKGEKVEKKVRDTKDELEVRDALNQYFHSKSTKIDRASGFKSVDGEAIIPTEIIYQYREETETKYDLEQYVTVQSVSHPKGTWPILQGTTEVFYDVKELEANPSLGNPKFKNVDYDIKTKRGEIAIAEEAIDDAEIDLVELIAKHILEVKRNTSNKMIAPIFKSFTPAIAKDTDALKKVVDVMIDPAYDIRFFMSQTMFWYLDTLKDKNGRYLLQDDITSPSGKRIFGYPIVVLKDTLIGDYNGQMACFIGDSKKGVWMFDRKQISARWVDHHIYGQVCMGGYRADYRMGEEKAGYYCLFAPVERDVVITTSDEQTPETVEGVEATIAIENNIATIKYTGLTGQTITYSLKDSKGAVVASMVGRFTVEKTEDTITVTFAQDMVMGNYTLEAKVLDGKSYKCIKSVKLNLKQKSDEIAKTLNGSPIVISSN